MTKTPASLTRRVFASLIDCTLCVLLLLAVQGAFILLAMVYSEILKSQISNRLVTSNIPLLFCMGIGTVYYSYFEGCKGWHASLGKRMLGLMVEKSNGSPANVKCLLVRCFMYYIVSWVIGYVLGYAIGYVVGFTVAFLARLFGMTASIDLVIFLALIFSFPLTMCVYSLPAFFTKNKLLPHDWLSKTRVVYIKGPK